MKKLLGFILILVGLWLGGGQIVWAQSDAQKRQAAAEAYDRGTAAYLAGNYAQAAQWFETANRLAPAAAALMQAIRAHKHANNDLRAATLALQLTIRYSGEPAVVQYGGAVLKDLQDKYLRVDVTCESCTLDLDGALQEYLSFFVEPNTQHTVVAHYETGDAQQDVTGAGGETRQLVFEAPQGTAPTPAGFGETGNQLTGENAGIGGEEPPGEQAERKVKPLSPVYTYILGGVTIALGAGTVVAGVSALSGVKKYEDKAAEANNCNPDKQTAKTCDDLKAKAHDLLKKGESKEMITNILIGVTAGAAVATAVVAIFFTNWSGGKNSEPKVSAAISPVPGGGLAAVSARY